VHFFTFVTFLYFGACFTVWFHTRIFCIFRMQRFCRFMRRKLYFLRGDLNYCKYGGDAILNSEQQVNKGM
jgi:hypothetical protein